MAFELRRALQGALAEIGRTVLIAVQRRGLLWTKRRQHELLHSWLAKAKGFKIRPDLGHTTPTPFEG